MKLLRRVSMTCVACVARMTPATLMACATLAVLFFSSLVFSAKAAARELNEIQKAGTIVFLTEGDLYPFSYFDGEQLTGFEIELGNAIAKRLELKVTWRVIDFDAILPAIHEDRGDAGIASHAYTELRATLVDFAKPHYCSATKIVSYKGGSLTRAALKNKILGTQIATIFSDEAKKMLQLKKRKSYRAESEVFEALKKREIDAILSDKWVYKAVLDQDPTADIVVGEEITSSRVSIIIHKGNKALLSKINEIITEFTQDKTLRTLSEKYLRTDITCPE